MQYFIFGFFSIIFYLGAKNCNDNEFRITKYNYDELIETPFYIYRMSKKECLMRLAVVKTLLYFLMILTYVFIIMISIFNMFLVSNFYNNFIYDVFISILIIIALIWSIVSLIFFLKINLYGKDYFLRYNNKLICNINYRIIKNTQKEAIYVLKGNLLVNFFIFFYSTFIIIAILHLTYYIFNYLK